MINRAVFLDRDGVINQTIIRNGKPYPPDSLEDFVIFAEAGEAIRSLRSAGFLAIVVTNQPDVATGKQSRGNVEEMHRKMAGELPLDAIKVCYHAEADACACRKPKPGMILESAKEWDIDLSASYVIGDRWKDIEAGINAGCKTIFIENTYDEKRPVGQDWTACSILEASRIILNDAGIKISDKPKTTHV